MVKNRFVLLQWLGKVLLLILAIGACSTNSYGPDARPKRKFISPEHVQPQMVKSTWRFETIFSPRQFQFEGQDWLAVDSMGRPAIAYGGSQLNYAWFDGTAWQVETIDSRPGSGKYAHLLFDVNDQPHIVYATGNFQDLSLDTIYRDSQGWHHQTIDTDFYYGFHLDVILDHQGNPVVAYESNSRDNGADYYDIQIRVAYQAEGKWKITLAGEQGTSPSLAIDREARLHLGYLFGTVFLVDTIYQPDGTWQEQSRIEVSQYANVSDLLIDADLQPHFFYCDTSEIIGEWACMLYHTWLAEHGWQTEQVGPIGRVGVPSLIVLDSAGQIYILGGEKRPKLLRRDTDGWQELGTLDEESGYYPGLSLILDQDEQVHAAYFKRSDYTIHYAVEQNGTWQNQIVDQGNEPYWASPSGLPAFSMVYDRRGQLHIAHYDAQGNVHFRSKSASGWQDEVVARIKYLTNPSSIELLFDMDAQPHIFYENIKSLASGDKHVLEHAFQVDGIWVSEDVPLDPNDEGNGRSFIGINPEGQPAFVETQDIAVEWRYRTLDGWNTQPLGNIRASSEPRPQIAFPQGEVSTAISPKGLLPDMFYFDYQENALTYRAFSQEQYMIVPALRQNDELRGFAMRQLSSDSQVFLVLVVGQGDDRMLRYALYQNGAWRVYELRDLYAPAISDQVIGPDGSVHLAYSDYISREPPLYYVEGKGSAWKKTLVTGYTAMPSEMILEGTALNQNGEFCLLLIDLRANSLILGCLESIEK